MSVWRPDNARYDLRYIHTRDRGNRQTVTCWGWITRAGPGAFVFVERTMRAVDYVRILEEVLVPSIQQFHPSPNSCNFEIIQDNSPVHTARICREWQDRNPRYQFLNMPAKSPDLNPIENVWSFMTPRIRRHRPYNTRDNFIQTIGNTWTNLRNEQWYFEHIVDSMPKRLQFVIERNGYPIPY